ncbi:hypothetical protein TIFTF001_030395 [Ficus carica]|uniref:Uncharacterized protein n=1 Tax=Ficus carica TaxID=3494 RepID=A0AA88DTL9_FICCA|nr:hypothetical protein TIFTF001_030395 [Ficus carica]
MGAFKFQKDQTRVSVGVGFQDRRLGSGYGMGTESGFGVGVEVELGYKTEIEVRVRFWDEVGLRDGGWGRVSGLGRGRSGRWLGSGFGKGSRSGFEVGF